MLIWGGVISLLIWLYLFFFHGHFWRLRGILVAPRPSTAPARLAVIIPARNEVEVISRSVGSLLRQAGGHAIDIIVVDDGSNDGTAEAALRAASFSGPERHVTVLPGRPLIPGWSGKLWAMQQGIEQAIAGQLHPDFFLLTDADIEHAPESVTTLVEIARQGGSDGFDLVSFMVRLSCQTFAERALIPAFVFFFLKLYPPSWIANPRYKIAGAAGGSILIRPEALERAGGIASIRDEVIDDCALARRVKDSGGKIWLGMINGTQSIRPYGSFREIGRMISRGAFNQLRHSFGMLLTAIVGLTMTYLLPPVLLSLGLFRGQWPLVALSASAWLLMAICFLPMVRFYRLNPLRSLALPLVAIFYMGATVHSALKFWSGRGGEWKGRIQDPLRNLES